MSASFSSRYTLYSSEGCHLCEQAYELCKQANISELVEVIDIVEDEKLVEKYGICIPVLAIKKSTKKTAAQANTTDKSEEVDELFWPFTLEQLENFK